MVKTDYRFTIYDLRGIYEQTISRQEPKTVLRSPLRDTYRRKGSLCPQRMRSADRQPLRAGPGRSTPGVIDLSSSPKPAVFYDMTIDGPVPSYTILPDSEMARRYMADALNRELAHAENEFAATRIPNISPSVQGRGSP